MSFAERSSGHRTEDLLFGIFLERFFFNEVFFESIPIKLGPAFRVWLFFGKLPILWTSRRWQAFRRAK